MSGRKRRKVSDFFETVQEVGDDQFLERVTDFLEEQIRLSEENKLPFNLNHIRSKQGDTLLHVAVSRGLINSLEFLLQNGADVEAKTADEHHLTALHFLANKEIYTEKDIEIAKTLCKHKATVDAQDKFCNTPLWLAADVGNLPMVKFLLDRGADVNMVNKANDTPLHVAVKHKRQDTVKIVRVLLKNEHINPILTNKDGDTPLHVAVKKQASYDTIKELVKSTKNACTIKNKEGQTPVEIVEWQPDTPENIVDLLKNPGKHLSPASAVDRCKGNRVDSDSAAEPSPAINMQVNFVDNRGGNLALGPNASAQNVGSSEQQQALSADSVSPADIMRSLGDMRIRIPSNVSRSDSSAAESTPGDPVSPAQTQFFTTIMNGNAAVGDGSTAISQCNAPISCTSPGATSVAFSLQVSVESDGQATSAGTWSPRSSTPPSPLQVERA